MIFPTGKSSNTKENEQKTQRKNQLWLSPKTVSSTTFPDFALAAGLYTIATREKLIKKGVAAFINLRILFIFVG